MGLGYASQSILDILNDKQSEYQRSNQGLHTWSYKFLYVSKTVLWHRASHSLQLIMSIMIDLSIIVFRQENAKSRQKKVKRLMSASSYIDLIDSPEQLRLLVLCLRLTTHAVIISVQKSSAHNAGRLAHDDWHTTKCTNLRQSSLVVLIDSSSRL